VRGIGPMVAMEIVRDFVTREPAPELVDQVVKNARERGLLLIKAGLYGNVLRILVPLTIDPMLLRHALEVLSTTVAEVFTPVGQPA
jgi:4-aminobutyrate aminotransferase/(S)-3-amino-2-methylpropionate transaminase